MIVIVAILFVIVSPSAPQSAEIAAIERDLEIVAPGTTPTAGLDLAGALRMLNIPSISVALIDRGKLAWTRAWGSAPSGVFYQAASLSKLVTAVAALRLVEKSQLDLDRNVNDDLKSWRVPDNDLSRGHPVTLRGLLSMTGGTGVPGYVGYEPGTPLPNLVQILDGEPPANSPPVRVIYTPGTRSSYSGGGYEVVQALIEAKTGTSFDEALRDLVFWPLGMTDSTFTQPLPDQLAGYASPGHYADGRELPGGWRVMPELAAGGLWSTPADLAKLLVEIGRAYRAEETRLISRRTAVAMLTPQNGGPYGLGGAVAGSGDSLVLMKRGQNLGYQAYMLIFPEAGQGIIVMTGSDNGTTLATALIRRASLVYGWPPLGQLAD